MFLCVIYSAFTRNNQKCNIYYSFGAGSELVKVCQQKMGYGQLLLAVSFFQHRMRRLEVSKHLKFGIDWRLSLGGRAPTGAIAGLRPLCIGI